MYVCAYLCVNVCIRVYTYTTKPESVCSHFQEFMFQTFKRRVCEREGVDVCKEKGPFGVCGEKEKKSTLHRLLKDEIEL